MTVRATCEDLTKPLPPAQLTGKRFGYLTVVEQTEKPKGKKRGGTWWRCRCDCGVIRVLSVDRLTTGNTKSCGRHRARPPGSSGAHAIFCQYRYNAKKRGLSFELTEEQFVGLATGDCRYCGCPPLNESRCGGNSSPATREASLFIYNGIDRVDSSVGYATDNCVPCCKLCNWAKLSMDVDDFLDWIHRVYDWSVAPVIAARRHAA